MKILRKIRLIFALGIILIVLPFLGVPGSWRTVALVIIGALLIGSASGLKHAVAHLGDQKTPVTPDQHGSQPNQ